MRVSPVGFAFNSVDEVLKEAKRSAEVTHNHPEGIKGAQAVALAIFLSRQGESKDTITAELAGRFGYNFNRSLAEIRPRYHFDETCQGSVSESIIAFFESQDYESAIRNAVSLGGDADTMACIAGGIAQAFYKKIPNEIVKETRARLPSDFLSVVDKFNQRFGF
jgi:ADP-ribosylglycohydrolase